MTTVPPTARFRSDERSYVLVRIGALVVLFGFYALGLIEFEAQAQANHYLLASAGFALASAIVLVGRGVFRLTMTRSMIIALPVDLGVIAALVYALEHYEDPVYPLAVLIPVYFSLFFRRREAWLLGILFAAAYVVGHLPGHVADVGDYAFIIGSALALVLINGRIAYSQEQQRLREEEALAAIAAKEALNDLLRQRVAELQAVSEIGDLVHSSLDFDDAGPRVLEILTKVINIPSCCLFVVDKARSETLFSASSGPRAQALVTVPSADDGVSTVTFGDEHFSCISILDHKQMLVVFCADSDAIEALAPEDELVLSAVANELVVAVENSQLYKLTRRLAVTDELTGLYNYRHLQQRLDDEIERARRYGHSVALLMIDVDDFKGFNDAHGHIAGDAALADLGAALVASVREVDIVCRYGGEEFAIILPESGAEGAYIVAEKVRERVEANEFADAHGARHVHLTVSVGLAVFPAHAESKDELLREADDALYRAKHGGKNRVRTPTSGRGTGSAAGGVEAHEHAEPSGGTDDERGDR